MRRGVFDRIVLLLEQEKGIAAGALDPLLERRPPVLARPEDRGDEEVGEAALAEMRRDALHELAAARIRPLLLVRREIATRVRDDEVVGVSRDGLEAFSLEGLEVVECVEERAKPDESKRPWVGVDGDGAIGVSRGEERVEAGARLRLERGDKVHSDR